MAAPGPASTLDPATRRVLSDTLARFGRATRERGEAYAREGRVRRLEVGNDEIRARVHGSEDYDVTLLRGDDDPGAVASLEHRCSCPIGVWCKHTFAVLRVLLGPVTEQTFDRGRPSPAAPRRDYFPRMPGDVAAARRAGEESALKRIRRAPGSWERESGAASLISRASLAPGDEMAIVREARLDDDDPDLRCWRLAQAIALRDPHGVPAVLEPYRDRPDLAERLAEREVASLREHLATLATGPGRPGKVRSLRCVLDLRRAADGSARLDLQVRVSSSRTADAPRGVPMLRQLRSEAGRDPSVLAPEQAMLLATILEHEAGRGGSEPRLHLAPTALRIVLEDAARFGLATWSDALDPALARRCAIEPGAPVIVRGDAAQLVPWCRSTGGVATLELRFLWPDGRTVALAQAAHVRGGDGWSGAGLGLVVAAGAVSPVASVPPPHLIDRFVAVGTLPLSRKERVPLISKLAARWPHLRTTLARHTRRVPVAPLATLDLRDDDWLQIRLLARSEAAGASGLFEHVPGGVWLPASPAQLALDVLPEDRPVPELEDDVPGTPPKPASAGDGARATDVAPLLDDDADGSDGMPDVWQELPDLDRLEPLEAWREATGAQPGDGRGGAAPGWPDRGIGWWLQVSPRRLEQLIGAWQRRPHDVTYLGNERARRLLAAPTRVTAKLRVAASGVDFLAVSAEWQAEGAALSEDDVVALRSASTRFVKLEGGWVQRDASALEEAADALADLGVEAGAGEQRLTLWQLAGTSAESLATLEQLGGDLATLRAIRELRARIAAFRGLPRVTVPRTLAGKLRPYQRDGFDFLCFTATLGTGAILADDMGLGKTIQTLAWLEHLRRTDPDGGPSLVVCPASVVHNWEREAARFTRRMRVLVLARGGDRDELRRALADYDLVLTNYALLRRDAEAWQATELRAVVLDEAQNVKNPDAAVTRAALGLRARHRVALTGTPLENRPLDLWSIASFVCPGYLGSRAQFTARYDRPELPAERRRLLAARLRPILLRRLKTQVARELPERIEERRDCELTSGQRKLYLAELARSRKLVEELASEPDGLKRNRITVLAALTRLRQICCHPALAGGKAELGSGKVETLLELLEPLLAEGHKVLLFSQFVACLKILARELAERGIAYHVLTGETVERGAVVQAFTDDPRPAVFLLSLKAGGTGLNLTAASYVVVFDPWWNPAVEAQAIDRSHRIGQDRTVIAYRLVARGTIEEKIAELQERKASLVRDVLGDGGSTRALSRDDLGFLLSGDP